MTKPLAIVRTSRLRCACERHSTGAITRIKCAKKTISAPSSSVHLRCEREQLYDRLMRRIIHLALLLLVTAGPAMAETKRSNNRPDSRPVARTQSKPVARHQNNRPDSRPVARHHNNRPDTRSVHRGNNGNHYGQHKHYTYSNAPRHHSHVRHTSGYYTFKGGHRARYYALPSHPRYVHRHIRPVLLVERYDPVPGYIWIGGYWNWGGAHWVWSPGYYAVAY
jgi:hypothetical protein